MTFQNLETPATIAASVRRTGAHQAAEQQFGTLNDRRDQVVAEVRDVIAKNFGKMDGESSVARDIRALEKERLEIEAKLRPLVTRVRDCRVERAARVAKELASKKRIAAQRML